MAIRDGLQNELLTIDDSLTKVFLAFTAIPTLLGAAHHVDHIIRGTHIGWPITPEVNPFTYSLAIYPILSIGFYLTVTRRVGARFWAGFFAFSTGMLAYFHISPWAVEPPQDVILPYADPVMGYLAFGVLLALIASVAVGTVYGALLWYRHEPSES